MSESAPEQELYDAALAAYRRLIDRASEALAEAAGDDPDADEAPVDPEPCP